MAEAVPLARFADLIPAGALEALPPRAWRASVLPGGRQVNLSLRLDDGEGAVAVLRVRRGPALAGADFRRELECQRLAAAAGLSPRIRAAGAAQGWMLMDLAPGVPWSPADLLRDDALEALAGRLRALHRLEPPGFAPVDPRQLLEAHCTVLAAHGVRDVTSLLARGREATARIEALPRRPPVLCHGDPDAANFVGTEPWLIDFEYAQVADPTYDLALLLDYYPLLEARLPLLQRWMGVDDALSLARLPLQRELCRLVNVAWAHAQRLLGRPDGPRLD